MTQCAYTQPGLDGLDGCLNVRTWPTRSASARALTTQAHVLNIRTTLGNPHRGPEYRVYTSVLVHDPLPTRRGPNSVGVRDPLRTGCVVGDSSAHQTKGLRAKVYTAPVWLSALVPKVHWGAPQQAVAGNPPSGAPKLCSLCAFGSKRNWGCVYHF